MKIQEWRVIVRWNGEILKDETISIPDADLVFFSTTARHLGNGSLDARYPDIITTEIQRIK